VTEIVGVQRMEGEMITLQSLFEFKVLHYEKDRKIVGSLAPTGLRPTFLEKFAMHGIELSPNLFGDETAAMFGLVGDDPESPAWLRRVEQR
jgi:pilus assembly protein CpaF